MGDLEVWFNHHENCPIYLTSLLVERMQVNGLTSSAPHTSNWRPARAKAARMMPILPSKLAANTSAPNSLSSHHETALGSSLTETLPYCTPNVSKHSAMPNANML